MSENHNLNNSWLNTKLEECFTLSGWSRLPLWDLAFRPGFLLAGAASVVSIVLWLLYLNGVHTPFSAYGMQNIPPVVWHVHEMIFGFAVTVAIAFLLTAVQTWTGRRSVHGGLLILLTVIWLFARVLFWTNSSVQLWQLIVLQGMWWLISIAAFSFLVLKTRNRRNYIFMPLLCIMMALNVIILWSAFRGHDALALHLSRSMILLLGLLVSIVGGRVIPFFTQRGLENIIISPTRMIDRCLMIASVLGIVIFTLSFFTRLPFSPAVFMIAAGVLHLLRLGYWRSWNTARVPLLWSLHIAYLFLSIGLVSLGASYFIQMITFSSALHLVTIGTVGGMVLTMMARVSLGHTGRLLTVSPWLSVAFLLVFFSAFVRFLLPVLGYPFIAWNISGMLWVLSFTIFVFFYVPILLKPRVL